MFMSDKGVHRGSSVVSVIKVPKIGMSSERYK